MRRVPARILLGTLLLLSFEAWGHRPSDAYLTLKVNGALLAGRWEIALRDLAALADLDANRDRQLTWGELRGARIELERALLASVQIQGDEAPCSLRIDDLLIHDRLDGRHAWFSLVGQCPSAPRRLAVRYDLLFTIDPSHRGIVVVEHPSGRHGAVLAPQSRVASFVLDQPSRSSLFTDYLREGIHHIWAGLDHILFLVALLLPSVLVRDAGRWRAAPHLPPVIWEVTRVVTAFTLAHSVTLALAATGWLRVPGGPAEAVIAGSVILAALNNVFPRVVHARWAVAFGFGLAHGLGFASVIGEIGLPAQATVLCLLAFNVGVELGQMAIVLAVVPVAFMLRRSRFYQRVLLVGGSWVTAGAAAIWLGQRVGWIDA